MQVKSCAIVLSVLRYTDNQYICGVLTEQTGYRSFLVRRATSQRSAVRHVLFQPLAVLDLEWAERAGHSSTLLRPKTARLHTAYATLTARPEKMAIALYVADLLAHSLRSEPPQPLLFGYVRSALEWLDTAEGGYANFHLVFAFRLSEFLGISPNMEQYREGKYFDLREGRFTGMRPLHDDFVSSDEAAKLPLLLRMDFSNMHLFRFSRQERNRLLDLMNHYFRLHLEGFPKLKSLDVLRDVFGS